MVVTHVGLALAAPAEFVVVRIIHGSQWRQHPASFQQLH